MLLVLQEYFDASDHQSDDGDAEVDRQVLVPDEPDQALKPGDQGQNPSASSETDNKERSLRQRSITHYFQISGKFLEESVGPNVKTDIAAQNLHAKVDCSKESFCRKSVQNGQCTDRESVHSTCVKPDERIAQKASVPAKTILGNITGKPTTPRTPRRLSFRTNTDQAAWVPEELFDMDAFFHTPQVGNVIPKNMEQKPSSTAPEFIHRRRSSRLQAKLMLSVKNENKEDTSVSNFNKASAKRSPKPENKEDTSVSNFNKASAKRCPKPAEDSEKFRSRFQKTPKTNKSGQKGWRQTPSKTAPEFATRQREFCAANIGRKNPKSESKVRSQIEVKRKRKRTSVGKIRKRKENSEPYQADKDNGVFGELSTTLFYGRQSASQKSTTENTAKLNKRLHDQSAQTGDVSTAVEKKTALAQTVSFDGPTRKNLTKQEKSTKVGGIKHAESDVPITKGESESCSIEKDRAGKVMKFLLSCMGELLHLSPHARLLRRICLRA